MSWSFNSRCLRQSRDRVIDGLTVLACLPFNVTTPPRRGAALTSVRIEIRVCTHLKEGGGGGGVCCTTLIIEQFLGHSRTRTACGLSSASPRAPRASGKS